MKRKSRKLKSRTYSTQTSLSYDRLSSLFAIAQKINQVNDLHKLLQEILHSAITNIGAERGIIILVDQSGKQYQTVASESLEEEAVAFSTSIVQKTLAKKKTIMSDDITSDLTLRDAESVRGLNILSFICVPLTIPGRKRPLGTLYVDQRIYEKTFTKEDRLFLESLANLAAITISNVNNMQQLVTENIQLRQEVGKQYGFPEIQGKSKAMEKVFATMQHITNDDCTVLLTGESGSGKELIAKAIHYNSYRKKKSFLAINCGALPETLLEAELFGSIKGAFTGAVDKKGLLEAAEGGTLFLDEIQHTSEAMQIKLLRVLQEREIRRVGSTKPIKVHVRLICATNEDIQELLKNNRLRQDFYYRINVVTIKVPTLRERREDIPLLAQFFLKKHAQAKGKRIQNFDQETLHALISYDWAENNVRELANEIERAVIFAEDHVPLKLTDLSEKVRASTGIPSSITTPIATEQEEILTHAQFEKKYIRSILNKASGNKSKAAKLMGVPRTTLIGKMQKYGLK